MKGENYLYIQGDAAEANATDKCIMIPASRVLGVSVGSQSGTAGDYVYLSYEAITNTGAARGSVRFDVTVGEQIKAMDDLVAATNSNPSDGFVVICDVKNKVFCSPFITGAAINTTV